MKINDSQRKELENLLDKISQLITFMRLNTGIARDEALGCFKPENSITINMPQEMIENSISLYGDEETPQETYEQRLQNIIKTNVEIDKFLAAAEVRINNASKGKEVDTCISAAKKYLSKAERLFKTIEIMKSEKEEIF